LSEGLQNLLQQRQKQQRRNRLAQLAAEGEDDKIKAALAEESVRSKNPPNT